MKNESKQAKRKKANRIYNQCVIYTLIAGALVIPFLIPAKALIPTKIKLHKKVLAPTQSGPALIPAQNSFTHDAEGKLSNPGVNTGSGLVTSSKESWVTAALLAKKPVLNIPVANQIKVPVVTSEQVHVKVPVAAPQSVTTLTIQQTKIDRKFIEKMEGSVMKGYVPLPKTTQSGVTIASGFDLGQVHLKEFNQLPINDSLKAKLRPYVGLKRFQAVAFLKKHPLTINAKEMQQLDEVAANKILLPLVKNYNKVSKVAFTALPPEAQTALFSFAYQYGPGFMHKASTRQLWKNYVRQDWSAVRTTLRNFKMYAPRRHQEAQLVSNLV